MKNIVKKNSFQNLTYTMSMKTEKIISLKSNLDKQVFKEFVVLVILFILISILTIRYKYTIKNLEFLLNYFLSLFIDNNSNLSIKSFDAVIIIISIIDYIYYSMTCKKINEMKNDYNKLRTDIINTIDAEFCYHSQIPCSCKEDYIKDMNKEGIDLIFK